MESLGEALATRGHHVINGGGPGLMDAVLRGAKRAGGLTTGIRLDVPGRQHSPNADEILTVNDLHARQRILINLGEIYIAGPGGIGTLFEVMDVFASMNKGIIPARDMLLLGSQWEFLYQWLMFQKQQGHVTWDLSSVHLFHDIHQCLAWLDKKTSIDGKVENRVEYGPFGVSSLSHLEARLGYQFKRPELLEQALSHASYGHENSLPHNERLEFLGDSILGYLVARKLFVAHPHTREGDLSKQKSAIVSTRMLADKAKQLELGKHLKLSVGERKTKGTSKDSILADTMEAVMAAMTLDGGMEATSDFIDRLFHAEIHAQKLVLKRKQDFKTELQERLQGMGYQVPQYRLIDESGPAHERRYLMGVEILDEVRAEAWGTSKKNAQQAAAQLLLADSEFWTSLGQQIKEG